MNPNDYPQTPSAANEPPAPANGFQPVVIQPGSQPTPPPPPVASPPQPDLNPNPPNPTSPLPGSLPPAPTPAPAVTYGGDNAGGFIPPPAANARPGKRLILGIPALIILIIAGYVFGFYIPNKPENVYKTGVNRTGKAIDKFVVSGTSKDKLDSLSRTAISGSLEIKSKEENFRGSFNSRFDENQSDTKLSYETNTPGLDGQDDLSVQVLSDLAPNQDYPSIYFKFSGLSSLGLDEFLPEIKNYDRRWIGASSDYIKSVTPVEEKQSNQDKFNHNDAAELAKAISTTTREYVFNTDADKAVLVMQKFKGTEKVDDGLSANHYQMGLNKTNSEKYCKALFDAVVATKAYKKLPGAEDTNVDEDRKGAYEECKQSVKSSLEDNPTFDMWVDKKRKLIHKIRITEKTNKGNYVEIGQTYKSGDILPLFLRFHSDSDKYDGKLTLTLDVEKTTTQGTFDLKGGEGDDAFTAHAEFEFKPHSGDVKVNPPKQFIPISQLLETFGVDPSILSLGEVNEKSEDSQRKTDIQALQTYLEAYFSENGFYPSLANLNNASWRAANMRHLDVEALKDPVGKNPTLTSKPTGKQYGYSPSDCSPASQCLEYVLQAKLSSGHLYTKNNLD